MAEDSDFLSFRDRLQSDAAEALKRSSSIPTARHRSKHAPKQLSSKFPVSRFKSLSFLPETQRKQRETPRDPRFERYAGHFNRGLFEKSYGFVEEYMREEQTELEQALKDYGNEEKRTELRRALSRKKEEIHRLEERNCYQVAKRQLQDREKSLVAQGKRPYFLKRKTIRLQAMSLRLAKLEEEGKLQQVQAKKRKRNQRKEKAEKRKFAKLH